MRLSILTAAFVAALVGLASALAGVLAAAAAVGATQAQTTSWVTGLALAMAASSLILSAWHRVPVITAWSTPGAAVIAATAGVTINAAVGAFLFAGTLIILTAMITPLGRLIERIPVAVASAMLAGVLVRFVTAMFEGISLSISFATDAEARRLFAALSTGGPVQVPLDKTFFASSFGMAADRVRHVLAPEYVRAMAPVNPCGTSGETTGVNCNSRPLDHHGMAPRHGQSNRQWHDTSPVISCR